MRRKLPRDHYEKDCYYGFGGGDGGIASDVVHGSAGNGKRTALSRGNGEYGSALSTAGDVTATGNLKGTGKLTRGVQRIQNGWNMESRPHGGTRAQ